MEKLITYENEPLEVERREQLLPVGHQLRNESRASHLQPWEYESDPIHKYPRKIATNKEKRDDRIEEEGKTRKQDNYSYKT